MPQYSFILPKNLKDFILSESPDNQQAELIAVGLKESIYTGEKLTKKTDSGRFFYTFNIDIGKYAHRAIFERVSFEGKFSFLLRSIVFNHNYTKALRWQALNQVTEEVVNALYVRCEGYELMDSSSELEVQEDDTIADKKTIYYRGRTLIPTSLQAEILYPKSSAPLSMPFILVGPPGSGKTLIGMGLLQERAMEHCHNEDPNVLELCYVAESRVLVKQQQENWSDFAANYLTKQANELIKVHFHTVEEYAKQYAKSQGFTFLKEHDAQNLLKKYLGKDVNDHQELYQNAWRIYLDFNDKKSFNESLYKEAGASNLLYSLEMQKERYDKYISLMAELKQKKEFLCGISSMPELDSKHQDKFHLTIIDEAQRIHPALLQGFLHATENRNVLFIGDPYQKGGNNFSSLDALGALTYKCYQYELPSSLLPSSLRVQSDVAQVLNNVVLLYTNLLGGKADAISYSSLQHEEAATLDTTGLVNVHLLKHPLPPASQIQITSLGSNAHAAALVLNLEDKAQASKLINSANVFTATEVLGLEFSQILLYLSKSTLNKFIDISTLMKEQGIKPGQTLTALYNKPAEKGNTKGQMQKLLSDLLVALSRTQGALYVVLESPDNHKLQPFLDWFKACLGGEQVDVQIEIAHDSDEDWLHVINDFIQANALTQAMDNLQTKLKLTEAQADAYVSWCKQNQMMSAPAELQQWLTPAQLPADSLVEEEGAVPVAPSNTDMEPWEELHERFSHEGANAIELFLRHEHASELLFKRAMNNTDCLWVNLTLSHFNALCSIFAKPHHPYKALLEEGFQYAKATKNYLLLMCLARVVPKHASTAVAKQYLCEVLMQGDEEFQTQLIELLLKSNYLDSLTKEDFFNTKISGIPQLAHVLLSHQTGNLCQNHPEFKLAILSAINASNGGYVNVPGAYQGQNLITCLLDSESGGTFFEDKKSRELILKKWTQLFGKTCPGPLHRLCQYEKGIELLKKYVQNIDSYFNTFLFPIDNGLNQGASAFYFLCESDSGVAFLDKNWAGFAKVLQKTNVLFTPVSMGEEVDKGMTPFYRLCCSSDGLLLLSRECSALSTYLKKHPDLLFTPVESDGPEQGMTPFYHLCSSDTGVVLMLKKLWSNFASHLEKHPDLLFTPVMRKDVDKGMTPFYRLCCRSEGLFLLYREWSAFSAYSKEHPDLLFASVESEGPEKGMTPFYHLCTSDTGAGILPRLWPASPSYLEKHPDLLFAPVMNESPEKGMTPFFSLCRSAMGAIFIHQHWSIFFPHLKEHLNLLRTPVMGQGSDKGKTPFFSLSRYEAGIILFDEHWSDLFPEQSPDLLFAPIKSEYLEKGMTAFYHLCTSEKGARVLCRRWPDFAAYLKKHPDLLFTPVLSEGPEKGMTPFHHLCARDDIRIVFNEFFNELDESTKKTFVELINEFLKNEHEISEGVKICLQGLQLAPHVTQEASSYRFFPIAKAENNTSDYVEQKLDDIKPQ